MKMKLRLSTLFRVSGKFCMNIFSVPAFWRFALLLSSCYKVFFLITEMTRKPKSKHSDKKVKLSKQKASPSMT